MKLKIGYLMHAIMVALRGRELKISSIREIIRIPGQRMPANSNVSQSLARLREFGYVGRVVKKKEFYRDRDGMQRKHVITHHVYYLNQKGYDYLKSWS